MSSRTEGIAAIATALLAFAVAGVVGGNGFIAAFVAGLCFGSIVGHKCTFLHEFAEEEGLLLTLLTFFLLGSALLPEVLTGVTGRTVLFALAALTVLRMVPVGLALVRSGLDVRAVAFVGWFGPRGLATILFLLLIVGDLDMTGRETITTVALTTVMLSILLHGVTASPLADRFPGSGGDA
jgi:NhaP-type Na+/H+ or K+/H+ antiporter